MPTVAASVPGYEAAQWYGILVPAATPDEIVQRLNREFVKVVQGANMKARLLKDATTLVDDTSPHAFGAYMRSEIAKWDKVVKFSGARVE